MQMVSIGDNEIGGDRFDERLRNLVRSKHAESNGIEDVTALEQPGMAAKLFHQCETVKIRMSDRNVDSEDVFIRNFLRIDGPSANLVENVTRQELDQQSLPFVERGLSRIDQILEQSQLSYQDIELCLSTGGMVNMPAIRDGLIERFVGRVPKLENGDRIISEGAAWIANDGLRLTLSKPIEILVADTSGYGTFFPLVDVGWRLPLENETQNVANTRLFCTDPREGIAVVEIAKPAKLGRSLQRDPRRVLCVSKVKVDPNASPLLERIECHLQIDHDYVAKIRLRSTGLQDESIEEFHELEFGLSLIQQADPEDQAEKDSLSEGDSKTTKPRATKASNLAQRPNIVMNETDSIIPVFWNAIPGDLIDQWKPYFFSRQSGEATERQMEERSFYVVCAICGRSITRIILEGQISKCSKFCGFGRIPPPSADTDLLQER